MGIARKTLIDDYRRPSTLDLISKVFPDKVIKGPTNAVTLVPNMYYSGMLVRVPLKSI